MHQQQLFKQIMSFNDLLGWIFVVVKYEYFFKHLLRSSWCLISKSPAQFSISFLIRFGLMMTVNIECWTLVLPTQVKKKKNIILQQLGIVKPWQLIRFFYVHIVLLGGIEISHNVRKAFKTKMEKIQLWFVIKTVFLQVKSERGL